MIRRLALCAVAAASLLSAFADKKSSPGSAKSKITTHYESIVRQWLSAVNEDKELRGIKPEDLAHRIVSHGGWACYATLIQLHQHIRDTRKHVDAVSGFQFGVKDSVRLEILRMCGADEDGVLPLSNAPPNGLLKAQQGPPEKSQGRAASTPLSPSAPLHNGQQWVFNRQHNGLGNQVFQYLFSRLLAEAMGRSWRTSLLEPQRRESPWAKIEYPPNSEAGWALFRDLFSQSEDVSPRGLEALRRDANSSDSCLDEEKRCVISDRPWDQHKSRQSLLAQLITVLFSGECADKCVFVIGYFQDPLFYSPMHHLALKWLSFSRDPTLDDSGVRHDSMAVTPLSSDSYRAEYPPLGAHDIVVHVRCCQHSGGGCDWLYLPFEYYDAVLSRLTARAHPHPCDVFVVAPCPADCPMLQSFKRKYGARHVTPPKWRDRSKPKMRTVMANDFRFLMRAPTLVLGKSTYGFWAGYLSPAAGEVHMPVEARRHQFEKIPVVTAVVTASNLSPTPPGSQGKPGGSSRFVYHNPGTDEWFGKVDPTDTSIRYEERGRWFGPKLLDHLGNFIVEKKKKKKQMPAAETT